MKFKIINKDCSMGGPALMLISETVKDERLLDQMQIDLMKAYSFNDLSDSKGGRLEESKISKRVGRCLKVWPRWAHSS